MNQGRDQAPFHYQAGELHAERRPLADLAALVGTPFYCYSSTAIEGAYREFEAALAGLDATICFAMKANSNLAVVKTLARLGAGADVVSGGELQRALAAGVPPAKIVFSGVGKSSEELAAALDHRIHQINVESEPELTLLSQLAAARRVTAKVALRVNPDVDARTHAKITTGTKGNKFGIDIDEAPRVYAMARELPGIQAVGAAVHIGSQLTQLPPFRAAFGRVAELVTSLREQGHDINRLDLGGGLGIAYRDERPPAIADYAAIVRETVGRSGCSLTFEPGRRLVGDAGVLVSRVLFVKEHAGRRFIILDAAMNDLIRPAMYEAWHDIMPIVEPDSGARRSAADIVGPVCESSDTFATGRSLPPLAAGDLVAFSGAGAYGAVMASTYNSRPLIPEVMVRGEAHAVIRARQSVAALLAQESMPNWLDEPATARHAEVATP